MIHIIRIPVLLHWGRIFPLSPKSAQRCFDTFYFHYKENILSNSKSFIAAEGSSSDSGIAPLASISKARWIVATLATGLIAWFAFTYPPKVWRIPEELANVGALSPKADQDKLAAVNNENMWKNTLLKFGLAGSAFGLIGFFMLDKSRKSRSIAATTLGCGIISGLIAGTVGLLTRRYLDADHQIPLISTEARPLFCDIIIFSILSIVLLIPYAIQIRFNVTPTERGKSFSVLLAGLLTGILVPVIGAFILQGQTSIFPPDPADLTALWLGALSVFAMIMIVFSGKRTKSSDSANAYPFDGHS